MEESNNKKRVTSFFGANEEISRSGEAGKKLNDTIKRLYSEINNLNLSIREKDSEIKEKSETIERLTTELEEISKKLSELKDSNNALKKLNLNRLKTINDLTNSLSRQPESIPVSTRSIKGNNIYDFEFDLEFKPNQKLQTEKVALFTAIDSNLIEKTVTCFNSYALQNPGKFDFFIITSNQPTTAQKDLCDRNHVKILFQNLHNDFKVDRNWPYPSECFWVFRGPEIFYNMGYKFSMSVDTDTFCVNPLDFEEFNDIKLLGGAIRLDMFEMKRRVIPAPKVKAYDFVFKLENNTDVLERHFGTFNKESYSMNSGVLIWNNDACNSIGFYRKIVSLFKKSKDLGFPRKGDDSLLSMFISLCDPKLFKHLGPEWNYYYLFPEHKSQRILEKIKIVHMMKVKPWRYDLLPTIRNGNIVKVIEMWRELESKHNTMKEKDMKLWWFRPNHGYNFGDEITPWLFKKMYGVDIEKPCDLRDENILLGVGSIMRLANKNTEVWGSGIRNIDQQDFDGAKKFHVVRGPFTRKRLLELGMQCPQVYGDPGMLLPTYYSPEIEQKYELGIVPHLVDREAVKKKFGNFKGVKIIDLDSKDIEDIVDQFLECKHIVSTSLHGIITAVAYGIPVKWMKASDKINGDDIKFYDFWASLDRQVFHELDADRMTVDIERYQPVRMEDIDSPAALINKTHLIPKGKINPKTLIQTCPYR